MSRTGSLWAVVLLASCGQLTVEEGLARLEGRVVDRAGQPVAGARMALVRDRRPVAQGLSAADGRFALVAPPGPLGIFGHVEGDQGVWRAAVDLLPAGVTEVGPLEVEALWAYPDVLWLRGVGFDEQLTKGDDGLSYLAGGDPGEPLLVTKRAPGSVEVLRVDEAGETTLLSRQPAPTREVSGSLLPDVSVVRSPSGRRLVLFSYTGYALDASGVRELPNPRAVWVDAATGEQVFEVTAPPGERLVVAPRYGAFVGPFPTTTFASLEARRTTALSHAFDGTVFESDTALVTLAIRGDERVVAWLGPAGEVASVTTARRSQRTVEARLDGDVLLLVDVEPTSAEASARGVFSRVNVVRFGRASAPLVEAHDLGASSAQLGAQGPLRVQSACPGANGPVAVVAGYEGGLRLLHVAGARTTTQTFVGLVPAWETNGLWWCATEQTVFGSNLQRLVWGSEGRLTNTPTNGGPLGGYPVVDMVAPGWAVLRGVGGVDRLAPPGTNPLDARPASRVPAARQVVALTPSARFALSVRAGSGALVRAPVSEVLR